MEPKQPAWIQVLLDANESLCMDNAQDKQTFAVALTRLVTAEREQVIHQIATWLEQRDGAATPRMLADMVRRGEWNG